jgi:hypothetical protein
MISRLTPKAGDDVNAQSSVTERIVKKYFLKGVFNLTQRDVNAFESNLKGMLGSTPKGAGWEENVPPLLYIRLVQRPSPYTLARRFDGLAAIPARDQHSFSKKGSREPGKSSRQDLCDYFSTK